VTVLRFEPRCIGANYGWICAGGVENGQFAAIRVSDDENPTLRTADGQVHEETEFENVPVYPRGRSENLDGLNTHMTAKYVRTTELGGTIVNSITLHKLKDSRSDGDVVAVLTYVIILSKHAHRGCANYSLIF